MRFLKNWKLRREIKKYQKKEMRKSEIKERKVNYIFWGIVLIASFALVYYFHFSDTDNNINDDNGICYS